MTESNSRLRSTAAARFIGLGFFELGREFLLLPLKRGDLHFDRRDTVVELLPDASLGLALLGFGALLFLRLARGRSISGCGRRGARIGNRRLIVGELFSRGERLAGGSRLGFFEVILQSPAQGGASPALMCRTVRAMARMKWTSWLMKISVPSYCWSALMSASIEPMSRWVVGSSMRSRLGGSSRSFTSARRDFSPPLKTPTGLKTSSPRNRTSRAPCGPVPPRDWVMSWTLSSTVCRRLSDSIRCWEK